MILIGNAGNAPEITTVKGDKKVAKFGLAVNEYSKNENGEKIQNTQWFDIVAWDKAAETLAKYLKKGDQVFIEGKLVIRRTEKDGVKYTNVDIVVKEFKLLSKFESNSSAENTTVASAPAKQTQKAPAQVEVPANADPDVDDLPF